MVEQKILCECGRMVVKSQLKRHQSTNLHLRLTGQENNITYEKESQSEEQEEQEDEQEQEEEDDFEDFEEQEEEEKDNFDEEFLNELETNKFVSSESKLNLDKEYINEKKNTYQKLTLDEKINKFNKNKMNKILKDDDLEILGADKRRILQKITQYKELFPDELKKLKINKKLSVPELNLVLDEIQAILDCSNTDSFMMEGIYSSLKVIENVSSLSKNYNIQGLVEILKSNTEFNKICRQLFVKYNCYTKVEPEYKLFFIISVSSFIVIQKNRKMNEIENYLNKPL